MKPIHLIPALALALVLAACGGEPDQPAKDAHANDAADHGTEADEHGHEADEVASTVIAAEVAEKSGIKTQPAGPGVIADEHEVQGLLTPVEGRVAQVTASQSTVARATIDNADNQWRPGTAVKARITVAQEPVDLMVPLTALQSMDGQEAVFVREGETYLTRHVELGARDATQVQILSGLSEGEEVVVAESYLIKADIGKEGAAHDH